mgnify:CR=1 FL=1
MTEALLFAILANLCFSTGSLFFTKYSRAFGALKFNTFKAQIALICFAITILFFPFEHFPNTKGITYLALSGLIGLAIGDIFIFNAFKKIGPARTLTLFGLRPLMMAILTNIVLNSPFKNEDIYPSLFFILCLVVFARENYQKNKSWELAGLLWGVLGVFLDSTGVLLTRIVFDENPLMTTFHANIIRTAFAVFLLMIICLIRYKSVRVIPIKVALKDKLLIFTPILGTYIALIFFIQAIKTGNLIIVSAVGVTGPIFASTLECLYNKSRPSKHLLLALLLFIIGMVLRTYLMTQNA